MEVAAVGSVNGMDDTQDGVTPREDADRTTFEAAIQQFAQSKGKVGDSGRYATDSKRLLERFEEFAADRGVEDVESISSRLLESYAQHLDRRVQTREQQGKPHGISGATAHQYFARVRAWLEYLVKRDLLSENPAKSHHVEDELPDESLGTTDNGQQFWSPATRKQIVRWTDWYFDAALDDEQAWVTPADAARERALIATVAYSGARGAELFRDLDNDRRNGLRWRDVDLDAGTLSVLGKSQEIEEAPLLDAGRTRLADHYRRQNPKDEDWPVWVTRHPPSLYAGARMLDGVNEDDDRLAPDTVLDVYREHGGTPPALSIGGARRILREHSDASGLVGSDGDHLKLHGARRGLGDELYTHDAEAAQEALRHQSIETTHKSYRDRDGERVRERAQEILDGE